MLSTLPVGPHCSTQHPGSRGQFRDHGVELGRFRGGFRDQGVERGRFRFRSPYL